MPDPTELLTEALETLAAKKAAVKPMKEAHDAAKAEADAAEQKALDAFRRARQETGRPIGSGITFTAVFDAERGHLTDRKLYFQWALDHEPSLEAFIDESCGFPLDPAEFRARLHEAVRNLSILKVAERQELLNRQVRAAHEDEQPLPPGLDFDPIPYVSMTKA